jgi:hypothetical protein
MVTSTNNGTGRHRLVAMYSAANNHCEMTSVCWPLGCACSRVEEAGTNSLNKGNNGCFPCGCDELGSETVYSPEPVSLTNLSFTFNCRQKASCKHQQKRSLPRHQPLKPCINHRTQPNRISKSAARHLLETMSVFQSKFEFCCEGRRLNP